MIYGLDKDFKKIFTFRNYIEASLTEKYNDFSQYLLYTTASEYDPNIKYIHVDNSDYLGLVNQDTYKDQLTGEFITYTGYTLEYILNNEVFYPSFVFKGKLDKCIEQIYNTYFKTNYNWILDICEEAKAIDVDLNLIGDLIGSKLYEILETYEMGYKLVYDYKTNTITLKVYQGLDRSYTQKINNPVMFSSNRNNIQDLQVITDNSNYKNYIIVESQISDTKKVTGITDLSQGGQKRKIYVEDNTLEEPTAAQLKDLGKTILLTEYGVVEQINCILIPYNYIYLKDFNLGDKVELQIVSRRKSYEVRIVQVERVYRQNKIEINLVLGNRKPSIYKKIRRVRK